MFDFGSIIDSYGNSKVYFTLGYTIGLGASVGGGFSATNKNVSYEDLSGESSGINLSLATDAKYLKYIGIEGFKDFSHGAINDHYGNKVTDLGFNISYGSAWYFYHGYTFISPLPPKNFWERSGRH